MNNFENKVAVIDPGPLMDGHLAAILKALNGRSVEAILITHTHLDHSPLAAPLAAATGAPVMAFGAHGIGTADELAGQEVASSKRRWRETTGTRPAPRNFSG